MWNILTMSDSLPPVRALALATFEANGKLVETGNHLVKHAGLTSALWQVLGALGYAESPLTVSQVAKRMGLTRQGVQRVVNILVDRGYVALQPNPFHRRAPLVALTRSGRSALTAAEAAEQPLGAEIIEAIGAERIMAAAQVLRELNDVLEQFLGTRNE